MSDTTGYEAYALFQSIKLHFTTDSYNFFRYNGKTNTTKDSFSVHKAKYSFYKLSRKYDITDLRDFYVANFLESDIKWIGELTGPDSELVYKKWQKRNQSLTYLFEQDIIRLLVEVESPNKLLTVEDGQYPILLKEMTHNDTNIETVCILNDIMNFLPMWNKKISDDVVWPSLKRRIEKYTPFLTYDKEKFKLILKESLKEHAEN